VSDPPEPAPSPQQPPQQPQGQAPSQPADEPREPLWRRLQRYPATVLLVAAVVVIFLLSWRAEPQRLWGFSLELHEAMGGYSWRKVRDEGQTWRLVTDLLVCRMALDAVFFVYLCVVLAPTLERSLGTLRFLALFVIAGAGGHALAEVRFDLTLRAGGPMIGAYALLCAIPGVVLGLTWSLKKTVADPGARSAVFWIGFSCLLGYLFASSGRGIAWDFGSTLCAGVLALLLGITLALSRRDLKWGLIATLLVTLIAAFGVGAVHLKKRWRDGALVDRGVPNLGPLAGPLDDPNARGPDGEALTPAQRLADRAQTFLDQFSPLPSGEEQLSVDQALEAKDILQAIEAMPLENGLDPAQIRLLLLLGETNGAYTEAGKYAVLAPSAEAQALYGTAAWHLAVAEWDERTERTALRRLEDAAMNDARYRQRVPEVLYLYARALDSAQRFDEAKHVYGQYLEAVGGQDPQPYWRGPLLERARLFVDPR
jgi:rhomboid protease GluP